MTSTQEAAVTPARPARGGWIAPRSGGYTPKAGDHPRTAPPSGRGASSASSSTTSSDDHG